MLAEWCGARNGRRVASLPPISSPASECTMETSSISSGVSGGRMEGSRAASIDLPEPGCADHQEVVPAGGRHLEHALGALLTLDVPQVGQRRRVGLDVGLGPRQRLQPGEVVDQRQQVGRRQHGHVLVCPCRLGPASRRADQPLAHGIGADRRRQGTRHGADRGIQRQLADGGIALEIYLTLLRSAQNTDLGLMQEIVYLYLSFYTIRSA